MITKEEIRKKLETNQKWLERGILAIWEYQTAWEQRASTTIERNGVGFNGVDGSYFAYIVGWLEAGKHLNGRHLEKSRKKMLKYSGQLARIANSRVDDEVETEIMRNEISEIPQGA